MDWCSILLIVCLFPNTAMPEWRQEGFCNISRTSNKGTEFILAFTELFRYGSPVKLFASSLHNVSIEVYTLTQGLKQANYVNSVMTEIVLDGNLEQEGIGIRNGGVLVRSSTDISLYGLRDNQWAISEAFTAIPVEALSTTYVVSSYTLGGFSSYGSSVKSQVCIVGIHNDTLVSVKLNITSNLTYEGVIYNNGDTLHVVLSRLQSFVLEHRDDLSGTIVTADRPISVFSGGILQIPDENADLDKILSQLMPLEHWDTEFIVPPLYPRKDSILRIYAFYPNTSISIGDKYGYTTNDLKRGGFIEHVLGMETVTINSSKPISVVQYAYGVSHDSMTGDPLMIVLPGLHQFSSEYIFPTISEHDIRHYISIIIKSNSIHGLRLDGELLTGNYSVHFNEDNYTVINKEMRNATHSLTHLDVNVKFGAVVYGFGVEFGYGFPAGMEFTKIVDCDTSKNTLPTTLVTLKDVNLVCFSCTGLTHLKYCDIVEKCTDNLGCFVEKYQIGSHTRYNSGCVTYHVGSCEPNHNVSGRCSSCCNTSFCNSHGCGDEGFRSSDLRGPLCFDCQQLDDPSDCINIVQCAHEEHCRFPTSALNPNMANFQRSVSTCSSCCQGDFCNTKCTMPPLTPIIG